MDSKLLYGLSDVIINGRGQKGPENFFSHIYIYYYICGCCVEMYTHISNQKRRQIVVVLLLTATYK